MSPDEGPDDSRQSSRLVLLGFVRYKHPQSQDEQPALDDFKLEHEGLRPRFSGVRADTVEASGGKLILRSRPAGEADAPMIVIDQSNPDEAFVFGIDNGQGNIKAVIRADTKGNLKADGTITGVLTTGQTLVQSGSASDGVKLPLPSGVTEQQVEEGKVALHIMVNPKLDALVPPTKAAVDPDWVPHASCFVDQHRRVNCTVRWLNHIGGAPVEERHPAVCTYLIVANVPSSEGGA